MTKSIIIKQFASAAEMFASTEIKESYKCYENVLKDEIRLEAKWKEFKFIAGFVMEDGRVFKHYSHGNNQTILEMGPHGSMMSNSLSTAHVVFPVKMDDDMIKKMAEAGFEYDASPYIYFHENGIRNCKEALKLIREAGHVTVA